MIDEGVLVAVAAEFQLGRVDGASSYVDRGVSGEVYRVTTPVGRWALKRLFHEPNLEQMEIETRLQESASAAGVVSPRGVRTAEGSLVVAAHGAHWRVSQWLDATPAVSAPVELEQIAAAGSTLAAVHGLRLEPPAPMVAWLTTPPTTAAWEKLQARVRELAPSWAPRFEELCPEFLRLSDLARAADFGDAVLGHCDFTPDNVGIANDHLVVFDWERASAIPPMQELGYALWHWSGLGDAEQTAPAFVRGYGAVDLTVDGFGSAAAAWLNFFYGQAHAGNENQTMQMLNRPMTRDAVQTLVELVR